MTAALRSSAAIGQIPRAVRRAVAKECERFVLDHIERGQPFAVETTLRTTAAIDQAVVALRSGFVADMHFVAADSIDENIARVVQRAQAGGHARPNGSADVTRERDRTHDFRCEHEGFSNARAYGAAKAALRSLARSLAAELGKSIFEIVLMDVSDPSSDSRKSQRQNGVGFPILGAWRRSCRTIRRALALLSAICDKVSTICDDFDWCRKRDPARTKRNATSTVGATECATEIISSTRELFWRWSRATPRVGSLHLAASTCSFEYCARSSSSDSVPARAGLNLRNQWEWVTQ